MIHFLGYGDIVPARYPLVPIIGVGELAGAGGKGTAVNERTDVGVAKVSRVERNAQVRKRLFDAAARIVGSVGYADASIARITEEADVAQGTFYKHFANRQALFDELLPTLGREMARYIQDRTEAIRPEADREFARFRAFFDYLDEHPGFRRILNEAEFAAPAAFQRHLENMAAPFRRMLIRARDRGEVLDFDDGELEVVVHLAMGARSYLSQRFAGSTSVDDAVFSAYRKLFRHGLFPPAAPDVGRKS